MRLFPLEPYFGQKICVALSGGMDSVCLLHYLATNRNSYSIELSALTCEHGIRGENSLADLQFAKDLCAKWNIPLAVFQENIPLLAKQNRRGLEEEGRLFRYRCFQEIYEKTGAVVATAHHKNDYAETVLFRLIRGTSLSGVNAFPPREGICRPLLSVTRETLASYAQENALSFVTDETNSDENYTRNYLRNTVLPHLEQAFCGATEHLAEFAERAQEDEDFLQSLAKNALTHNALGEPRVPLSLPTPLFSRACVLAMKEQGLSRDYTATHLQDVAQLKNLQSGKKITLPTELQAVREYDEIVFCHPAPPFTGEIPFETGNFSVGEYCACVTFNPDTNGLRADLDAFPDGCVIRTKREGDEIVPFGGNRKRLKKFFTDKKIPARVGNNLPVIAIGNEILAVFGVEISDKVKVTYETKREIRLCIQRKN